MKDYILSILIFLPIAAGLVTLLIPRRHDALIRWFTLLASLATFALSVPLFFWFNSRTAAFQFEEFRPWVQILPRIVDGATQYAINYHLGIDGISLMLVLLATFLTPVAMLASWRGITERAREFYFTLLLLEGAMLGVLLSLDLILFYVFWDAMLIPMYFLIGVWGSGNRVYASIKFFIYTLVGSLLMLAGIVYLGLTSPAGVTFDVVELARAGVPYGLQYWLFLAFGLAFAIKVPIFPFHTWLPDAHTEAPTAGSVILAGVLLKMGAYGFLRFCLPLFPEASVTFAPLMATLGVIGIIYGALVAYVQPDMKRLVAYSSVSHLGFVVLGIFAFNMEGIQGALIVMVAHGLATGALFLCVGMIYDRRHTRMLADFGGVWRVMPAFGALFMIASLASLGLPGLSNFPGEFLVIVGAFAAKGWLFAFLAASGVVFAAVYVLWLFGRVMQGPTENPDVKTMRDLSVRELFVLAPVALFIVLLGLLPGPMLARTSQSAHALVQTIKQAQIRVRADLQSAPEKASRDLRSHTEQETKR